jgi:hypothetical protein
MHGLPASFNRRTATAAGIDMSVLLLAINERASASDNLASDL